jgi:hypothetical protein
VNSPTIAIPRADLIKIPTDAVVASITCFVSAVFGPSAINNELPPSHKWIDYWETLIKEGDKEFAANMAAAMNSPEFSRSPNALMLGLTHGAFAGVAYKEGRESEAWAEAAYAALCIGIVAGSQKELPAEISAVMTRLSAKGVEKRHAKNRQLREFAVEKYRAGHWMSANDAANQLKRAVMDEAERIGTRLSDSNAQRTIAEWFRTTDGEREEF